MDTKKLEERVKGILKIHEEVAAAYLYGSVARGLKKKGSDIDVGLLLNKNFKPDPLYEARLSLEMERALRNGMVVEARILNSRSIIFLHQVLKHGKLLLCRNERDKIAFETDVYRHYLDFKHFFQQYNEIRKQRLLT
jgi:predicted nucleotidyltransferase